MMDKTNSLGDGMPKILKRKSSDSKKKEDATKSESSPEKRKHRKVEVKPLRHNELTPHLVVTNVLNYFTNLMKEGDRKQRENAKRFFDYKTPHQLTAQACGINKNSLTKYLKPDSEKNKSKSGKKSKLEEVIVTSRVYQNILDMAVESIIENTPNNEVQMPDPNEEPLFTIVTD